MLENFTFSYAEYMNWSLVYPKSANRANVPVHFPHGLNKVSRDIKERRRDRLCKIPHFNISTALAISSETKRN